MKSLSNLSFNKQVLLSSITGFSLWLIFRHVGFVQDLIIYLGISDFITLNLQAIVHYTLLVIGIENHLSGFRILIEGSRGMAIIYGCLAMSHFALFTGLIMAYKGKWIDKLWYIPLGIIILHVVNALRLVFIGIVLKYAPTYDELSHYYFTRIFLYTSILLLWIFWVVKLSKEKEKKGI